jgi:hypothetical protein
MEGFQMRKLFSVAVLAAGLSLAAASSAQAPTGSTQRNDFCYLECQYRCYVTNPGGGPAWTLCYQACAREKCGWDG